jgi:hypothetical protein
VTLEPVREAVDTLLSLEDPDALEAALAAAEPGLAARAVNVAPTLEQKTTLLWAMDDRQRREALEWVPPALVGALVQNLEDDNRYLLGDISLEQFRALLDLCSPERKYYWIVTALSFTDARANALPLLLTTRELAEIFLTRAEFEEHVRALGDFPLEDMRLPPEAMVDPAQALLDLFGPEKLLVQFPVPEPTLAHVLQTILDYDPDRYVDLVREGLRGLDYAENHPHEWEALTEDPILLEALEAPDTEPAEEALPADGPPLALVPIGAPPLARLAAALPPARREQVGRELQYLYVRQAVAEGGSFARQDLERVARSVEAYLLLGLQAESGEDPAREAAVLGSRPLNKISQSGARVVERLRQVALRLAPLEKVLSAEQRALVRSLSRPRLTIGADGSPRIQLLPAGTLPEEADVPTATAMLHEIGAWTAAARALGLARVEKALAEGATVDGLLEELALAAALYGRVELGLAAAKDRERAPSGPTPVFTQAVEAWAGKQGADPALVRPLFDRALKRMVAKV